MKVGLAMSMDRRGTAGERTLVVDLAVTVYVGLTDHLIDLRVREFLAYKTNESKHRQFH